MRHGATGVFFEPDTKFTGAFESVRWKGEKDLALADLALIESANFTAVRAIRIHCVGAGDRKFRSYNSDQFHMAFIWTPGHVRPGFVSFEVRKAMLLQPPR